MQATLSRRLSSRITNSPTRSLGISFSPRLRSFSSIRAIDSSTESEETGRFLRASLRELANLSWLYSTRLPFFFTIAGNTSSTRSYVVKRLSHLAQRRRRRIVSPSSDTRVSRTWVSSLWQKGQRNMGSLVYRCLTVNREALGQVSNVRANLSNILWIIWVIQDISNKVTYLSCFCFFKATSSHCW